LSFLWDSLSVTIKPEVIEMDELFLEKRMPAAGVRRRLLKPARRKHLLQLCTLCAGGLSIYLLMCLAMALLGVL